MNKSILFIFTAAVLVLSGCSLNRFDISSYLKANLFGKSKKGTLVAKIDNTPVSLQEIRDEMRFSLGFDYSDKDVESMMSNPVIQKNYEDKIISQYLLMKKFLTDKTSDSDDFNKYLLISIKETIVKYYLYKNFFMQEENKKWKDIMITTDYEVLNFYNKNKAYFDEKNVTKEDALYAIRSDIEKRKSDMFLLELTKFQKNMIDELQSKYKVEKIFH